MPELIWIKDATGAAVPVAADVITNLNGSATDDGEFAQRVKAGWGTDGEFYDITPSTPLPIAAADVVSALAALAQDTVVQAIRDRLPAALSSGRLPIEAGSLDKGYQQLTSTAAAATIASLCSGAALPTGATKLLVVPTAAVRFRPGGVNPTATVGLPVAGGQAWTYDGDNLAGLKVYGAATLECWFYA